MSTRQEIQRTVRILNVTKKGNIGKDKGKHQGKRVLRKD